MVQSSLIRELEDLRSRQLTGLFVIDIQPDQREALQTWLSGQGVSAATFAPLVRGRLAAINGAPNARMDNGASESGEGWARRREWNISWRDTLGPDERITAGRFLSPEAKNEASVEQGFAKRLGVGLGDRLTVDLQGVQVEAVVTSLRSVKWTSFRPNFFVLMPRASLEGAPRTWVASLPRLDRQAQGELQARLVEAFPNLTAIDVSDAMERIAEMLRRLLSALRGVSALAVFAGLAVVTAIVVSSVRERLYEVVLWRLLGASSGEVLGMLCIEFAVWGALACVLGWGIASAASAYAVGQWFEMSWRVAWREVGLISGGVIGLTVVSGWLVSSELLIHPPLAVLRQE
jgi:putative ABC transport system permease protein